jgi:hypothetical protein
MLGLAAASFHGTPVTDTQKAYLPDDVTQLFTVEDANDFYNYSSKREDLAMLFEEVMMHKRYGLQRDVAITSSPTEDVNGDGYISGADYIVSWGQRGRIAESNIKPRAQFVTERVLPEFNVVDALNALPTPTNMTKGKSWTENLDMSNQGNKAARKEQANAYSEQQMQADLQRHLAPIMLLDR